MKTKLLSNLFLSGILLLSCGLFQNCAKDEVETTGTIYGIVNDSDNGEPVQDAHVMFLPSGKTANTGSDGSYEFQNLEPGQYTIQISKKGYYKTNTKRITVIAGEKASGDMVLMRGTSAFRLSTELLNFGSQSTSKTFTIENISTSGKSISWGVSKASPAEWLSVIPEKGSTASGKESTIVANIDRSLIKKDETATLLIDADGESLSVEVTVSLNESGEGGNQPDGGSCEKITQWDAKLKTEFTGCMRIGNTVEFRFNVTNVGEDVNLSFKSYGGIDSSGNMYNSGNSEFKMSNKPANILPFLFPKNVSIPGQIILRNVPYDVYSVARYQIVIENKSEPWQVLNTELKFEDIKW